MGRQSFGTRIAIGNTIEPGQGSALVYSRSLAYSNVEHRKLPCLTRTLKPWARNLVEVPSSTWSSIEIVLSLHAHTAPGQPGK